MENIATSAPFLSLSPTEQNGALAITALATLCLTISTIIAKIWLRGLDIPARSYDRAMLAGAILLVVQTACAIKCAKLGVGNHRDTIDERDLDTIRQVSQHALIGLGKRYRHTKGSDESTTNARPVKVLVCHVSARHLDQLLYQTVNVPLHPQDQRLLAHIYGQQYPPWPCDCCVCLEHILYGVPVPVATMDHWSRARLSLCGCHLQIYIDSKHHHRHSHRRIGRLDGSQGSH